MNYSELKQSRLILACGCPLPFPFWLLNHRDVVMDDVMSFSSPTMCLLKKISVEDGMCKIATLAKWAKMPNSFMRAKLSYTDNGEFVEEARETFRQS